MSEKLLFEIEEQCLRERIKQDVKTLKGIEAARRCEPFQRWSPEEQAWVDWADGWKFDPVSTCLRPKPKPKWRAFANAKEAEVLLGRVIRSSASPSIVFEVVEVGEICVKTRQGDSIRYKFLLPDFELMPIQGNDQTVCGVLDEEGEASNED